MNQTEIEQYYLNVELVNQMDDEVLVYYDITDEEKFVTVDKKNRTSLFNVIHSVTMPLSISFKAVKKSTLEQLYLNGREVFESPLSYVPNDFIIITISDRNYFSNI